MEWLGILLLYLISGFMKKREQNQKRKEIESEPDWDLDDSNVFESLNKKINLIKGEEKNFKITTKKDLILAENYL